jgi:hypothetical protein
MLGQSVVLVLGVCLLHLLSTLMCCCLVQEVDVFADTSVMTFPRSGLCTVEVSLGSRCRARGSFTACLCVMMCHGTQASFWSELEDDAGGDDHSWC